MNIEEFKKKYSSKIYIGDSIYVIFDGYHIFLEIHNGYDDDPRNVIGIEPLVFHNLLIYQKQFDEDLENIK